MPEAAEEPHEVWKQAGEQLRKVSDVLSPLTLSFSDSDNLRDKKRPRRERRRRGELAADAR